MLGVIMLNVIILNVIMLSVVVANYLQLMHNLQKSQQYYFT
jgi:hypothetical protein